MDEHENPGFGPLPNPGPVTDADLDADFDEFTAWLDREEAAGRNPFPAERAPESQGIAVSLGVGDGIDPRLLAAVCGMEDYGCPDGAGGRGSAGLGPQFAQDAPADVLSPSPVLAALTEAAVADVGRLSDNQLVGVLQAARRQENREAWKKALVIAEFARRRAAELDAAAARGVPVHCRPGQFPGEELAAELLLGPVQASHAIDDATDLATRLPATLAGMAAGLIDEARAGVIALHTRGLSPENTALADGVLAALAPGLRLDQLARRAAALEMKLDPEAVRARREHARRTRQRVEVRREESGNASVAGREMDTGDALAAKAHIHALALRLRRAGVPGTLDQLRSLVFADLTAGRDPLGRLSRPADQDGGQGEAPANPRNPESPAPASGGPGAAAPSSGPGNAAVGLTADDQVPPGAGKVRDGEEPASRDYVAPADDQAWDGEELPDDDLATTADDWDPADIDWDSGDIPPPEAPSDEGTETDEGTGTRDAGGTEEQDAGPGRTAGGADRAPGSGGGSAFLDYDHDDGDDGPGSAAHARPPAPMPAMINLVVHAGTLFGWGTTPAEAGEWGLLDADETRDIVAAASRHPATRWCMTILGRDGAAVAHGCSPGQHPWMPRDHHETPTRSPVSPDRAQAAHLAAFLRSLNLTLEPIARGGCDHAAAEPRYTPGRKLTHLVRARTATCDAPGCAAQAVHADLDHTIPYPDGPTDQCNLGPKCRRHHKVKQSPGWKVEQPEPGVIRWTLPSGRTHTTRPTVYEPR